MMLYYSSVELVENSRAAAAAGGAAGRLPLLHFSRRRLLRSSRRGSRPATESLAPQGWANNKKGNDHALDAKEARNCFKAICW